MPMTILCTVVIRFFISFSSRATIDDNQQIWSFVSTFQFCCKQENTWTGSDKMLRNAINPKNNVGPILRARRRTRCSNCQNHLG